MPATNQKSEQIACRTTSPANPDIGIRGSKPRPAERAQPYLHKPCPPIKPAKASAGTASAAGLYSRVTGQSAERIQLWRRRRRSQTPAKACERSESRHGLRAPTNRDEPDRYLRRHAEIDHVRQNAAHHLEHFCLHTWVFGLSRRYKLKSSQTQPEAGPSLGRDGRNEGHQRSGNRDHRERQTEDAGDPLNHCDALNLRQALVKRRGNIIIEREHRTRNWRSPWQTESQQWPRKPRAHAAKT